MSLTQKRPFPRSGSDYAGVYVAVDYCLDRLAREDTINILGVTSGKPLYWTAPKLFTLHVNHLRSSKS